MRLQRTLCLAAAAFALACSGGDNPVAPNAPAAPIDATDPAAESVAPPSFAIARAASSTGVNAQSGESTLKIDKPADVVAGDFLLAQITFEKGADINNLVAPSGWTLVRRTNSIDVVTGTDLGQAIFRKFATGSEPADYTWEFRKGTSLEQVRAAGGITRYTGVDPDNPIVASSGGAGDGIVLTAPEITAEAKSVLVAFFGHKKLTTLSNPTGMDHIYHEEHSNQSGPTVRASQELRAATGATGSRISNADAVVGADKWVAQLVALRAAATVTVNKVVVNEALGAENDVGRFNLQVNGTTHKTDAAHNEGTGQVVVSVGSVTVAELAGTDTDLGDYVSKVSCDNSKGSSDPGTSHTFTINTAEDVICTITNTRKAVLTVTKTLVPAADNGTFNLEIDGATAGTGGDVGNGGTTGPIKLAPGLHTVSESAVAPTVLTDYTVAIGGDCAEDGTITLASGAEKSCTITNTRKASITVNKVLSPTSDAGKFNLEIGGTTAGTGGNVGNGGTTGAIKLAPGEYTVSESAMTGTALSNYDSKVVCDNGKGSTDPGTSHTFSVAAGESVTCTITNTRKAAGFAFFLYNRTTQPSTNTTRLANLPMSTVAPSNMGSLPNYDTNGDAAPGRLVQKNAPSASQTDLTKYQNWTTPAFGAALVINKATNAEVKIWTAMKDLTSDKTGQVRVYIRDCPGTPQTSCVLIGQADYTRPLGSPFSQATVSVPWTFAPSTYTVAAGRLLEVKVVVRDTSADDMWFGYDTQAMPASFAYQP
jgi:hypothetical protein